MSKPLIDVESVLACFGDTVRTARRAYVRALKGARQAEWSGESPGGLPWWRKEIDRPLEPVVPSAWIDELGRSTGLERRRMNASEFLEKSCKTIGTSVLAISAPGKRRQISRQRYLIAALAIER